MFIIFIFIYVFGSIHIGPSIFTHNMTYFAQYHVYEFTYIHTCMHTYMYVCIMKMMVTMIVVITIKRHSQK